MKTLGSWSAVLVLATLFCADVGLAQAPNAGPKDAASATPPEKSGASQTPAFKQEELDQMLAPIALYPDSLVAQIFMASTYPLEVVEAERWVKKNKNLKGNSLTAALEKEDWDPSVKSLVNFPQVLTMMSEQLEWTQNLGDAFIAQQKQVMDTVQKLRAKAKATGNLETSKEQKIIVKEQAQTQVIVIESADPQVIYVPTYNPTVVYGAWWYPAYPPRPYYPPGYVAGVSAVSFGVGVACGAAWGYAWGGCGWGRGDVDIDVNRNVFANNNINRAQYNQNIQNTNINNRNVQGGSNSWQHDPAHRQGASYRDPATSQRFRGEGSAQAAKARDSYRGRAEAGRQDLARGGADQFKGGQTPSGGGQNRAANRSETKPSGTASRENRAGSGAQTRGGSTAQNRGGSGGGGAFGDVDRGRSATQSQSNRGQSSRANSNPSGGGSRSGGGGARGGGGGRRR